MRHWMTLLLGASTLMLMPNSSQAAQNWGLMPVGFKPEPPWRGLLPTVGRRDHQVCAIGYHYAGEGICRRNGDWWDGRRPINWGPEYRPGRADGSVSFEGPNGGKIRVRW